MIDGLGFAVRSDRVRGLVDITEYVGVPSFSDIQRKASMNDPLSMFWGGSYRIDKEQWPSG